MDVNTLFKWVRGDPRKATLLYVLSLGEWKLKEIHLILRELYGVSYDTTRFFLREFSALGVVKKIKFGQYTLDPEKVDLKKVQETFEVLYTDEAIKTLKLLHLLFKYPDVLKKLDEMEKLIAKVEEVESRVFDSSPDTVGGDAGDGSSDGRDNANED